MTVANDGRLRHRPRHPDPDGRTAAVVAGGAIGAVVGLVVLGTLTPAAVGLAYVAVATVGLSPVVPSVC
jgi:hypothetical protein